MPEGREIPRTGSPHSSSSHPGNGPWFWMYEGLWRAALPLLGLSPRLRQGWGQRLLRHPPGPAEVWIQAASGGEAFLAREIISQLNPQRPLNLLTTTCTDQGMEILSGSDPGGPIHLQRAYFPFDAPRLMQQALDRVRPKVVVLLETELWPGLLQACAGRGITVLLLNARLSRRSLAGYLALPLPWRKTSPRAILAVSDRDAARYRLLFGPNVVSRMPNIKFDRCLSLRPIHYVDNPLSGLIRPGAPFVVLGSVRQQEEQAVARVVKELLCKRPATLLGLFPRHMHRLEAWKQILKHYGFPYVLRSRCSGPVPAGTVILWDTFGELIQAYALARAVFVGGSLAPLGG
ncbi:MAG: 3-deoxy-D-manno-octulosonic acid transferase, partial [Desulfohalobiaceae bacterium]